MSDRKMRTIAVSVLILLVCVVSVGFAAISGNLNLTGTGRIHGSDWSILFKNLSSKTEGTGEDDDSVIVSGTSANLSAVLKKPGDKVTFEFDVANEGNIDAKLTDIIIGGDYELYPDMEFTFRYNNDADYANASPKVEDALSAGETRPLIAIVEFDPDATTVAAEDINFTFTIMMVYTQGTGSTLGGGEEEEDTIEYVNDASALSFMYPTLAESKGFTKTNAAEPNTFNLTSGGIEYVFNAVTTPNMTGKNIMLSFDTYTTGVTNRGSGFLVKLRAAKESDRATAHTADYYAVLYDGTFLRIIRSTDGSLDSVVPDVSVPENSLGSSYNILIKTFNNLIHAELRNQSGQLIAQQDYVSNDFNSMPYVNNGIAYNNNVKIGNIKSTALSSFTNIVAFGDSNTYGDSLTPGLRIEESWPGQINTVMKDAGVMAINKGVTYHTSSNLVSRINNDVYNNKVTGARNIVIIYIGTNDFNQLYEGYTTAFNNLKNNIETMRSGAVSNGFEVWLVTFPVCNDTNGPGQGRNPGLRAYNNWIMNDYYGVQNKVPVVIDYADFCQDPNNIDKLLPACVASDSLHSSAYGNNWIAKEVRKKLK